MGHHRKGLIDAGLESCCEAGDDQSALEGGERWCCVHTQSNKESFAAQNLERQSYRCFLPTIIKTISHARRVSRVRAALFPRYLFAAIDVGAQAWRPMRNTFGVSGLIMENDHPKLVPFSVVKALMDATNEFGCVDFSDDVKVGQQVRMLSGPFFNLVGELKRLDDRGRVAVLLNILGGERLVLAERTALQPLAS